MRYLLGGFTVGMLVATDLVYTYHLDAVKTLTETIKADKRKACQVGWRHAVIHYEIYNLKPATEIEADAVNSCKDWTLE